MRLFKKRTRLPTVRRKRGLMPRRKLIQTAFKFPTPSSPKVEPVPYPGMVTDPFGDLGKTEIEFGQAQVREGLDILRSGRGIETAADEQNVRSAIDAGLAQDPRYVNDNQPANASSAHFDPLPTAPIPADPLPGFGPLDSGTREPAVPEAAPDMSGPTPDHFMVG